MTAQRDITVGELGEKALLARILDALAGSSQAEIGPGDDAAVIAAPGGRVVVSTDTLVHGPDFRLAWSSGFDLGWKSAAVNLADIAAMGARPVALFVALALPDDTTAGFVDDLALGLRRACEALSPDCAVEGGDLTASDTLTIAVTALGVIDPDLRPVLRSGARPGDVVAVAGELGAAARGVGMLFDRFRDASGRPIAVDRGILTDAEEVDLDTQLRPRPPIAAGIAAARAGATAMMDVSDGLLLDATRLADASRATVRLAPTPESGLDDDALRGGEDHALLACFAPDAELPDGFRVIGRIDPRGAAAVTIDGVAVTGHLGWDPHRDWDAGRG
ncbi:thiamine-phosphate kinase [Microbacterium dextranolyticum]|uniref:Thiamine-monophosphate kinase n=1 Tax=Microbacterium dextranolyticum TaxID=36806 RepID=A0A9W6HMY3_9MICO|nr:thiamine-phosphate kinase [Microbacterium dextranolyticum]MBM7462753.1 thiamine-monophosphate kinase [Microbacterium dextranolyticum]GLJ96142.1 thiamine-monophosphate kinase [Microbacterium dextranolyticum]